MATKKKEAQDLTEVAAKYRELALQVKELDKQAAPLKKMLLEEAAKLELDTLAIGAVTIEKRSTEKVVFDESKITPDWLYRFGEHDGRQFLKFGIDKKAVASYPLRELVEEVGGVVTTTSTYAVRI